MYMTWQAAASGPPEPTGGERDNRCVEGGNTAILNVPAAWFSWGGCSSPL